MSRYVGELKLNMPCEKVCEGLEKLLKNNGFRYIEYEYEQVFQKGNGVTDPPRFIKITSKESFIRIEGWTKSSVLVGQFFNEKKPDKKLNGQIQALEKLLEDMGSVCVRRGAVLNPTENKSKPPVEHCHSKADFIKNGLAPSIKKEYLAVAIAVCLFSAIGVISGLISKNYLLMLFFVLPIVLTAVFQATKKSVLAYILCVIGFVASAMYFVTSALSCFALFRSISMQTGAAVGSAAFSGVFCAVITACWVISAMALIIQDRKTTGYYKLFSQENSNSI